MNLQCTPPSRPLIIGHRGAKGHVAENTIASIEKAIDLGADGVEIDVFRCLSGEIVVFHDKTLDKLSNGVGSIEEKSLTELKELKSFSFCGAGQFSSFLVSLLLDSVIFSSTNFNKFKA